MTIKNEKKTINQTVEYEFTLAADFKGKLSYSHKQGEMPTSIQGTVTIEKDGVFKNGTIDHYLNGNKKNYNLSQLDSIADVYEAILEIEARINSEAAELKSAAESTEN